MVTCSRCGQSWVKDPALAVPCPRCMALAGSPCRRPSGHGCDLHVERDAAALAGGYILACTAAPAPEMDLFGNQMKGVPQ